MAGIIMRNIIDLWKCGSYERNPMTHISSIADLWSLSAFYNSRLSSIVSIQGDNSCRLSWMGIPINFVIALDVARQ